MSNQTKTDNKLLLATAIDNLTLYVYECNKLLYSLLPKCNKINCSNAATVGHSYTEIMMCDRCASETIITTSKNLLTNPKDDLMPVKCALTNTDLWNDVANATLIRGLHNSVIDSYLIH